ncbi:MAG: hypothetical protein D6698_15310, partial [Gammaproteobacteria bacterium]
MMARIIKIESGKEAATPKVHFEQVIEGYRVVSVIPNATSNREKYYQLPFLFIISDEDYVVSVKVTAPGRHYRNCARFIIDWYFRYPRSNPCIKYVQVKSARTGEIIAESENGHDTLNFILSEDLPGKYLLDVLLKNSSLAWSPQFDNGVILGFAAGKKKVTEGEQRNNAKKRKWGLYIDNISHKNINVVGEICMDPVSVGFRASCRMKSLDDFNDFLNRFPESMEDWIKRNAAGFRCSDITWKCSGPTLKQVFKDYYFNDHDYSKAIIAILKSHAEDSTPSFTMYLHDDQLRGRRARIPLDQPYHDFVAQIITNGLVADKIVYQPSNDEFVLSKIMALPSDKRFYLNSFIVRGKDVVATIKTNIPHGLESIDMKLSLFINHDGVQQSRSVQFVIPPEAQTTDFLISLFKGKIEVLSDHLIESDPIMADMLTMDSSEILDIAALL